MGCTFAGRGVDEGVGVVAGVGMGGGGIVPFGGPYCMMGRNWAGGGGAGAFGSFTANIVASRTCGSIVMVTCPNFIIESFAGLFFSSITCPFLFVGFVQYFSKIPSLIHL